MLPSNKVPLFACKLNPLSWKTTRVVVFLAMLLSGFMILTKANAKDTAEFLSQEHIYTKMVQRNIQYISMGFILQKWMEFLK